MLSFMAIDQLAFVRVERACMSSPELVSGVVCVCVCVEWPCVVYSCYPGRDLASVNAE